MPFESVQAHLRLPSGKNIVPLGVTVVSPPAGHPGSWYAEATADNAAALALTSEPGNLRLVARDGREGAVMPATVERDGQRAHLRFQGIGSFELPAKSQ